MIDEVQYVSILTGNGGGDLFSGEPLPPVAQPASLTYGNYGKLLTFKIGGGATLEAPTAVDRSIPEQPALTASIEDIARGGRRPTSRKTQAHHQNSQHEFHAPTIPPHLPP